MTHTVFLVHGMGKHADNWSDSIKTTLKEKFAAIPSQEGTSLDEFVTFKEIAYDRLFETQRKRWTEEAGKLGNAIESLNVSGSLFAKLVNFVDQLGEDNFYTTHILDVFMYRFTPMRGYIQAELAKEFLDAMDSTRIANNDWSIIAHSLGTVITHDTLQSMFTQPYKDSEGAEFTLNPNDHHLRVLAMLANVSHLLKMNYQHPYHSPVRPMGTATGPGITSHFISAWHRFDPFARAKRFKPTKFWYGQTASDTPNFSNIEIDAVYRGNVHDMVHYLSDPKVYYPLLKRLTNGAEFSFEQEDLIEAYQDNSPTGLMQKAKEKFDEFKDSNTLDEILSGKKPFGELKDEVATLGDELDEIGSNLNGVLTNIKKDFKNEDGKEGNED